jgi:hypothetical protein
MSIWEISIHENYSFPINHSVETKDDRSVRDNKMREIRNIDTRDADVSSVSNV